MDNEELMRKLREAFQIEAVERLSNLSNYLVGLEKGAQINADMSLLDEIFREAHSLKGAARSVGYEGVEGLCQSMENIFADWQKKKLPMVAEVFDYLHQALSVLQKVVQTEQEANLLDKINELTRGLKGIREAEEEKQEAGLDPGKERVEPIAEEVGISEKDSLSLESEGVEPTRGSEAEEEETEEKTKGHTPDDSNQEKDFQIENKSTKYKGHISQTTVRIPTFKLDSLLHKVEELIPTKLIFKEQTASFQELSASLLQVRQEQKQLQNALNRTLRQLEQSPSFSMEQVHSRLSSALEFLGKTLEDLQEIERGLAEHTKGTYKAEQNIGMYVDELLEDMKEVLMLPFSTLFYVFPGMVRELAREQGKEVELDLQGEEVEIDKRILEKMKDPLIHLVRNALDHGLEIPEERQRAGKPRKGKLTLSICRLENQQIGIQVVDDGAGIDVQGLKQQAVKAGILSERELREISEDEALKLLFKPSLSTSSIITEISGQGMGMNIVQQAVEDLAGRINIQNKPGAGVGYDIQLPVSLTTYRGLLIKVADTKLVVPSANVQRAFRIRNEEIRSYENRQAISLNGRVYSLLNLARVLGRSNGKFSSRQNVILVGMGERSIAFQVEQVLGEQEVLVKGLGPQLRRVPYLAGCTILGKGEVIPVLNVRDLLRAEDISFAAPEEIQEKGERDGREQEMVLVVEDTITSRMLLKNILEASGYGVLTAVDGKEALARLRTESIDVVVSDVEMPRMDGFELTRNIREEVRLKDLPVVLVTARESREDRERGIEVGANAYLVKSGFDQSNLLEVLKRLV